MGPAESTAKVSVTQFPLAMLRPLAARFLPGTTLTGRLSSEVAASWGSKAGKNGVAANLNVEGFSLGARALHDDVLQLAGLQADCQASWQADRLDIEKSSIQCDVGNALLTGTVPLGGKDGFSLTAIVHQRQEFSGAVDLARLAQMLPATLSLRQQMRIDSGQVQWVFSSQPGPQGTTWHGQLEAASLTATDTAANRPIVWNKPISAVFDAHDVAGGEPIVDRLLCESDFLTVEGAGTTDNLTAKFSLSLKQLADQLGQFVDFGGLQLAGEGSGNLAWKRSPQRDFDAGANVDFRGFQLRHDRTAAVARRQPAARRHGQGPNQFRRQHPHRHRHAEREERIRSDRREALGAGQGSARRRRVAGRRARCRANCRTGPPDWPPGSPMNNVQLAGGYIVEANGVASKDGGDLRQMRFAAEPLIVNSPWVYVNETRIDGTVSGSWNQQAAASASSLGRP